MIPKTARFISWEGPLPEVGTYLQTAAGSTYLILTRRDNQRPDAKSLCFCHLGKLEADEPLPEDAIVHPFAWNSRG